MNSVTADSFTGLVVMALERMAFVITERATDTPSEVLVDCAAHAVIELRGPQGYAVSVSATPGMVREVASGMMGMEPDDIDVDDHARATVDELANVLAGELVMLLTSGDAEMSLSLPREGLDDEVGRMLDKAAVAGFCVVVGSDTGRLMVAVHSV